MRAQEILNQYRFKNGPLMAKGLAFSLLFGTLPLLLLIVSLRSFVFFPAVRGFLETEILDVLPPALFDQISTLVFDRAPTITTLDVVTLGAFLVATNNLFSDLSRGMGTMLNPPERQRAKHRLLGIAVFGFILLLTYTAAVFAPFIRLLRAFDRIIPGLSYYVEWSVPLVLYVIVLTVLYFLFSAARLRIVPTILIATLSTLVFRVIGYLGTILIAWIGRRLVALGAAASVFGVLLYMKFVADVLLFSSVVVHSFAEHPAVAQVGTPDRRGKPQNPADSRSV
jgi:membrane protein